MKLLVGLILGVSVVILLARLLLKPQLILFVKKDKVSLILKYSSPIFRESKHKTLFTIKKI